MCNSRHGVAGPATSRWLDAEAAFAIAAVFIASLVAGGCSRGPNVVPVSGRVLVDGEPLPNVAVNFAPLTGGMDGAYASYGKTDDRGRYTLKLVEGGRPGASIGPSRVTLNEGGGPESDGAAPRVAWKLPPTARDGTLRFEVPKSGTDAADFEFRSAP